MLRGSRRIAAFTLIVAGAGCSLAPAPGPVIANYDFGLPPEGRTTPVLRQPLLVHNVNAPGWLDSPLIYYRLTYQDVTRPQAYADSRWVGSPAELFTNRLRARLAASAGGITRPADDPRAKNALPAVLEEFIQELDAPGRTRPAVRFRASAMGNGGRS